MMALQKELKSVPDVLSLHDLHVWAISSGKTSLTVHVVHAAAANPATVLEAIRTLLREKFGITHVTIQCELVACEQADEKFHFIDARHTDDEEAEHSHGHGH
ncbi:MAG: cation transporter [Cytophagaceae bacterium]|nr:MAG: cation transporter [Cytophagaceae bacterium]